METEGAPKGGVASTPVSEAAAEAVPEPQGDATSEAKAASKSLVRDAPAEAEGVSEAKAVHEDGEADPEPVAEVARVSG